MPATLRQFLVLLAGAAGSLLAGCAGLPSDIPRSASFARRPTEGTSLGRTFSAAERAHPGETGFHLLDYGLESLVARLTMADEAESTLDVQYYIYDCDQTGSLLTRHLLAAADRGVRVRVLLDDYNLASERELAALCGHRGVEVRVFNPAAGNLGHLRPAAYALNLPAAGRRMHNKLIIADNQTCILGGRNIGDDYCNVDPRRAFRDIDVLMAGPGVQQASAAFDDYWNSPWAIPAAGLFGRSPTPAELAWARNRTDALCEKSRDFTRRFAQTHDGYLDGLAQDRNSFDWAACEVICDPPEKIRSSSRQPSVLAVRFSHELDSARQDVEMEAAYFVPDSALLSQFRLMRQRGVSVRLVTSSLAATDVPVVYAAYRRCRRALLTAGVDLYEFRPHAGNNATGQPWFRARPFYRELHTRVFVFDHRRAWIGSFNLDPRSAYLNTEIAVIVDSPKLSQELTRAIAADCRADRSWHLQLESVAPEAGAPDPPSRLTWRGNREGKPVALRHEPAGLGRELEVFLLSLVPGIRRQL